ncbi:MAG: small ribosomal subunit Rsm22 family protein [Bdellovibrionota bacterium]
MGPERGRRPDNYLNQEAYFSAYLAYYFPLHLPELYWVLDQAKKRSFVPTFKRVLDVGSGPGTLSLSLLFWLQKENLGFPEELVLWDQSEKALKFAKEKVKTISDKTRVRFEKVHLPRTPKEEPFDLIVMGHVLNEWGAGPRFREKKQAVLKQVLQQLSPEGSLIILEPPLREPTLDLMVIRDELQQAGYRIVGPCPQSFTGCPLLLDKLGWCYAQPPRAQFKDQGFTVFDRHIEKLLSIKLTQQSFSYLWVTRKKEDPTVKKPKEVAISVTDRNAPRKLMCIDTGEIANSPKAYFRGENIPID